MIFCKGGYKGGGCWNDILCRLFFVRGSTYVPVNVTLPNKLIEIKPPAGTLKPSVAMPLQYNVP